MAIEGIKLAIIGMSVVFLFLALLVVLIGISTRLLKRATEKERLAITTVSLPHKRGPVSSEGVLSSDKRGRLGDRAIVVL